MKGDLLLSSLPVAVFVMVEAAAGLTAGVCCALGAALTLTVARAVRRQPLRPAIGAFIGVAIASFIAYRTGGAGGYFLVGIWWSLACCCVLLLSIVVRRPLVGVVWSVMNRAPPAWRADRPSVTGYDLATGALAAVLVRHQGLPALQQGRRLTPRAIPRGGLLPPMTGVWRPRVPSLCPDPT